jgi:diguanylate cyclase (GGDEF)-like protein
VVGRHGGEEFGILMIKASPPEAERVAGRIREAIANHTYLVPSNGELYVEVRVTASIGVAYLQPKDSVQSLLARSDAALYEAKRNGRNRVCVAT